MRSLAKNVRMPSLQHAARRRERPHDADDAWGGSWARGSSIAMIPRIPSSVLLVAFVAIASTPLPARAQAPEVDHALGLGLGYSRFSVLDEGATSLPYAANLVTGTLAYVGEGARMRWALRLGTAFGHEEAANHPGRTVRFVEDHLDGSQEVIAVPMRGTLHAPSAELSLEKRFDFDSVSLLVGGAARFDMYYVQGFTTPGLMQVVGLRPSVAIRYRWHPRHAFEVVARTTVLGWMTRMPYHQTVSRPNASPYEGLVSQGSGFRTVNDLQTFEVEGSYEHRFGAHGAARATIGLDWLHDAEPRPLYSLATRAALFVFYRF